jgi:hypothetical protein
MADVLTSFPSRHAGTAKACAQTVIAVWANAEVKSGTLNTHGPPLMLMSSLTTPARSHDKHTHTGLWWVSQLLVLLASAAYTHVRYASTWI